MINGLIVTENIKFAKKLFEEMHMANFRIRIIEITNEKEETVAKLKKLKIGIVFMDTDIEFCNSIRIIKNKCNVSVKLTYDKENKLMDLKTIKKVKRIIEYEDLDRKKAKVIKELQDMGYKLKHKGTLYLVDTIMQMYINQDNMIDNLQSNIYPVIAKKYHKTIINIKSSINKATECMYYECDAEKLQDYFKFYDDTKPTIKQVIFAVINRI